MPLVRMLVSAASEHLEFQEGDEVEMTPEQARVWADGVRGELVRARKPETPERRRSVETPE